MPDRVPSDVPSAVRIRLLEAGEADLLVEAIRSAYGDSYDADWVYDRHQIAQRISDGLLLSAIAEEPGAGLLCHAAMTLHATSDRVGHVGQAVTLPAARGHHLFTQVKRYLVELAVRRKMYGLYSEATAAHPYSQRANVDLGAHETGFLLGWIPVSVENDAALAAGSHRRQSVALFYLRTRHGPDRPAFVPARHRAIVHDTIEACGLHVRLADAPARTRISARSTHHTERMARHNVALVTVTDPGRDLAEVVGSLRTRFFAGGLACLYVDLPLEHRASAVLTDEVEELGLSYAGLFLSPVAAGAVLRLQALNGVRIDPGDISVVSDHGRGLLEYVLGDLELAGHEVDRSAPADGGGEPGPVQ